MDTRVHRDSRWPANQPPASRDGSARDGAESAAMDPAPAADPVVGDAYMLLLRGALTAAAVSMYRMDQVAVGPAAVRYRMESGDLRNGTES